MFVFVCASQTYLHECILRSDKFKNKDISDDEVLQVMRESFIRTDDIIMKKSMEGMWNDGCTVVALLLINKKFVFFFNALSMLFYEGQLITTFCAVQAVHRKSW